MVSISDLKFSSLLRNWQPLVGHLFFPFPPTAWSLFIAGHVSPLLPGPGSSVLPFLRMLQKIRREKLCYTVMWSKLVLSSSYSKLQSIHVDVNDFNTCGGDILG